MQKKRHIGTRIFDSFYITAQGVDWIEKHTRNSGDPHSLLKSIPPPILSSGESEHALTLFFSYAHADEPLREELEKHLSILQRQGLIDIWYDREISVGTEWKHQIDTHLNIAQIILLLVSPDFVESDYCYSTEMKRALERYESGEAHIIPILLRPVYYEGAPFEKLQVLPANGMPITSWPYLDEAFADVARGISKVVKELTSASTQILLAEKPSGS